MCRAHGTDCLFPAEKRRKTVRRTLNTTHASDSTDISGGLHMPTSVASTKPIPLVQPLTLSDTSTSTNHPSSQHVNIEWTQGQELRDTPVSLEAEDDNPHILGPAVMDDNHVLADYLSNIPGNRGMRAIRPVELGSSSSPIVFTKVQKRPLGMMLNSNPALHKLQVIEKLIEPWALHLVDM